MDENINNNSITPPVLETTKSTVIKSVRGGSCSNLADGALPVALAVSDENNFLPAVEARLAEEVLTLTTALERFGIISKTINEELPDSAQSGKLVTGLLSLLCFQFSHSLLKGMDHQLLLGEGANYASKLGLSLEDVFREIDLEGRKFLAIALIDEGFGDCGDRFERG